MASGLTYSKPLAALGLVGGELMREISSIPLIPTRLAAALGLVIASPVIAVCALAIKLSSEGTVLFRAHRVGQHGRPFVMLKLRTMREHSASASRITGGRDDPRVFLVGRWLRRFKLDELPQLINVWRGEMRFVGPRPEDPSIVKNHYTPFMLESLELPPGLTSPGSLAYYAEESALPDDPVAAESIYVAVLLPRKIAMDLVYVRNRTWRYDLELVARTLGSMIGIRDLFRARQSWERSEAARLLRERVEAPPFEGGQVPG